MRHSRINYLLRNLFQHKSIGTLFTGENFYNNIKLVFLKYRTRSLTLMCFLHRERSQTITEV